MSGNKTVLGFIAIVIIGLAAVLLFSNRGIQKVSGPDIGVIMSPSPTVIIPSSGTPTPTFAPISAAKGTINTGKGIIEVEFYPQDAPKTVMNFATLAKNKFYDGLKFHRVEPGFVIQGGDPLSKDEDPSNDGTGGSSIYGGKFADELNPETESYKAGYVEGTLAMANSGPNTNGSQFFIMWEDKTDLPKNYTIFGKVTTGMDVVQKMVAGDRINSITVE